MIEPVNTRVTNEYKQNQRIKPAESGSEQFSFKSALGAEDEKGVVYEPSESKKTNDKPSAAPGKKDGFERSLEEAVKQRKDRAEEADSITATANLVWGYIQDFFVSLWKNIKKIFGNLWDSKPIGDGLEAMTGSKPEDGTSMQGSKPGDATAMPGSYPVDELEKSRDERIKKALADGDKDRFRSLISEEGHKIPARSTGMLTTYNSKGRIKEIDPSDENKILHGDRGTRKL